MDSNIFLQIVVLLLLLLAFLLQFLYLKNKGSKTPPTNWPLLGMLPWLLFNSNRAHDAVTEGLELVGGTFEFKGPWFFGMDMVATCDPANIRYILARNFSNFPCGPDFSKIFEMLGDGILNVDSKLWEAQRKTSVSFLNHHRFQEFLISTVWNKLVNGIMPILQKYADSGTVFDLQDLLQRFTFDTTSMFVLGQDPNSLYSDIPEMKAFDDATEASFYRHIFPEFIWRIQKWLYIGNEKKLSESSKNLRKFITRCITLKRQQRLHVAQADDDQDMLANFLKIESPDHMIITASCRNDLRIDSQAKGIPEKLLVDILLNFLFAGRDTVSSSMVWFFWLLATNPNEQQKIYEEIVANQKSVSSDDVFTGNEAKERVSHLNYLHAALCESLRLFPPIALHHKAPREDDILPSGHKIRKNEKTILAFYSMGRMESIWGKDCLEFKPGRWISEGTGGIKHEPSFKYAVFGSGPRACMGKEMAFLEIKMVAARVLQAYHIEVAEGHPVSPSSSVVLAMKHGLKVRVSKRFI